MILVAAVSAATAQQTLPVLHQTNPSQPPLSGMVPLSAVWPQIDVNVFVLDRAGNPAPPADPHAFQLLQDGVPRTLVSTASSESPISLGLLIDTSGSTRQQRPQIPPAATALLNALPAGSEIMVVFFADAAYCDLAFAPVASFNSSIWQHLEARGGTALFDALFATERYFIGHASHPRRALVLISDGGENASTLSLRDTVRVLQTPGAPLLFVLSAPSEPPAGVSVSSSQTGREQANLRSLAEAGGGRVFKAHNDSDLPTVAAKIAAVMRSQTALSYRATDADRDGHLHHLEVRHPANGEKLAIYGQPAFYAPER